MFNFKQKIKRKQLIARLWLQNWNGRTRMSEFIGSFWKSQDFREINKKCDYYYNLPQNIQKNKISLNTSKKWDLGYRYPFLF